MRVRATPAHVDGRQRERDARQATATEMARAALLLPRLERFLARFVHLVFTVLLWRRHVVPKQAGIMIGHGGDTSTPAFPSQIQTVSVPPARMTPTWLGHPCRYRSYPDAPPHYHEMTE